MRMIIQRVSEAQVYIQQKLFSSIGPGFLVLLGIHKDDSLEQVKWSVNKLIHLRLFGDEQGKMNLNIKEKKGEILVVSQFTLYGNCSSGRRPDFLQAAQPSIALPLYDQFVGILKKEIASVQTGEFGADMQVALINDGPVTLWLDSER